MHVVGGFGGLTGSAIVGPILDLFDPEGNGSHNLE